MPLADSYLRSLVRVLGWRFGWALSLGIIGAAFEAVGLFALIPLLSLIAAADGASGQGLAAYVPAVLASVGVAPTLPVVLLVFGAMLISRAVVTRLRDIEGTKLRHLYLTALRSELFSALARARWPELARRSPSDLTAVLATDVARVGLGTEHCLRVPAVGLLAMVQIGIAIAISMEVVAIASAVGVALFWLARVPSAFRLGESQTRSSMTMMRSVTEFLGGLRLARAFAREPHHLDLFRESMRSVNQDELDFVRANTRGRMVFQIGAAVTLVGLIYFATSVLGMPVVDLFVVVVVFARLLPVVSELQLAFQRFVNMLPAYAIVRSTINECRREEEAQSGPLAADPLELKHSIRLDGVTWRYGDEASLKDVTIEIPAARMTAIVGRSGAGKSTLADILSGLIFPKQGTISVDGVALTEDRLPAWRSLIGLVPQDSFLFEDTIRANLLWAEFDATDADLWAALTKAGADGFVSSTPAGLDSFVGNRGLRLSGGERQRVALARALLRRPKLLVLDEATSALDSETETMVQSAIDSLRPSTTIVVIAHRLSTIRTADHLVVLEEGAVADSGSWEEVTQRANGPFQRLSASDARL